MSSSALSHHQGGGDAASAGRAQQVVDVIAEQRRQITERPGEFLPQGFPQAVYLEAAEAFRSCHACAGLHSVCMKPGNESDFWSVFDKAHTIGNDDFTPVDSEMSQPLACFIHAVVNQQSRVSKAWRNGAVNCLKSVKELPSGMSEDQAQSALQEILQICTASVAACTFFEMAGIADSWTPSGAKGMDDRGKEPPRREPSSLFKKIHPSDSSVWLPWVSKEDILPEAMTEQQAAAYEVLIEGDKAPGRVYSINPVAMGREMVPFEVFYMPRKEFKNFNYAVTSDKLRTLERHQLEIVAACVAGELRCNF